MILKFFSSSAADHPRPSSCFSSSSSSSHQPMRTLSASASASPPPSASFRLRLLPQLPLHLLLFLFFLQTVHGAPTPDRTIVPVGSVFLDTVGGEVEPVGFPSWARLNATSGQIYGIPQAKDIGSYQIKGPNTWRYGIFALYFTKKIQMLVNFQRII